MVTLSVTNEKYYIVRSIHDGYTTIGQYDSTFMTGRGGVFWICGSDDPYVITEVVVLKEIDTSW